MSCPHVPELKYSAFGQRLLEKAQSQRQLLWASLELTFRCNMRCQHCYIQCDEGSWVDDPELKTDGWRSIIDQLADAGVLWLLLTGGEPLLRPDFDEIFMYAKRKGMLITLFTNGTLVTEEIADLLAAYPPFAVEVSLYGRTAEVYEQITTVPGSYERCMEGIARLAARPILLRLKSPLMTLNQHEIPDLRAYAESLEVPFRHDPLLNAGMTGGVQPTLLRLSPEEVVAWQMADVESRESWCASYERRAGAQFDPEQLYVCGAGLRSVHIDPAGRLSICMMVREPSYNLGQGSLADAWDRFVPKVRQGHMRHDSACYACKLRMTCESCPAYAIMETGDPCGAVPYLCKVAHHRAAAMERMAQSAV